MNEFDLQAGREARDEGQEKALRAQRVQQWKEEASAWRESLPSGFYFTADDLRKAVPYPDVRANSNNVVGAMFGGWAKKGLIYFTGHYIQTESVSGQARKIQVWAVA